MNMKSTPICALRSTFALLALPLALLVLAGCGTVSNPWNSPNPQFADPSPRAAPTQGPSPEALLRPRTFRADISEEHRAASLAYMATLEIDLTMSEVIDNVIAVYSSNFPNVPQQFWKDFRATIDVTHVNELYISEVANVFTLEELTGINEWLATPLGQKYLTATRSLATVNNQHATQFGRDVSFNLVRALRRAKYMF